MRKLLLLLFSIITTISTVACAENNVTDEPQTPDHETSVNAEKILIVYFSRAGYNYPNQWLEVGHTARVAGYIKELTGGDTFEIVPLVPYPDDYEETKKISTNERDNDLRPEFKGEIKDIDKYDLVFIGGPVWYGGMPMIIHTFYDKYKDALNGKTIAPFSTHAGSGLADAVSLAKSNCPDSKVLSGLAVQGTNSANAKDDVKNWLLNIGVISASSANNIVLQVSPDLEKEKKYYNLQGLHIPNPSKGIYVEEYKGKSRKVKL